VDDDRFITEVYRGCLGRAGYEVEVAAEGAAALDVLGAFRPDVMLLDLMMPGLDGVSTLRCVRATEEFNRLPVVVSTNVFVPSMVDAAIEAGATKVFNKATLTPVLLLGVLREVLVAPQACGVGS
jgi:CheY-like chemotaxis protein